MEAINSDGHIRNLYGQVLSLINPDPCYFNIVEIARGLSSLPRFVGSTVRPYSVADHSYCCCLIAQQLNWSNNHQRYMLLHDAAESVISDIPRPVKNIIGKEIFELEGRILNAIMNRFDVKPIHDDLIKMVDFSVAFFEERVLRPQCPPDDEHLKAYQAFQQQYCGSDDFICNAIEDSPLDYDKSISRFLNMAYSIL